MTIAEQLMKKATDAVERRVALNLQAEGFPLAKIAQLMGLSVQEVENLVRPIAS